MTLEKHSEELHQRIQNAVQSIEENAIYFAHPINYYEGSKLNVHGNKEGELIDIISKELPYTVYNPNQPQNEKNYFFWKEETGSGMNYYFDTILPHMNAGIFLPFPDGKIGTGVFGEIEKFVLSARPAYEIDESGNITKIDRLDYSRKLSVKETQKRVYPRR